MTRALDAAASQLTAPLAVRSSATAEDSSATAFAGVFHSELNVTPDRLGDAARACWAFAFDWGAITHALRNNVDPGKVRIALLVQEMVAATRAGVLFTRDPSGARPHEAVVSSASGTAEALMQGEESGDTARIQRSGPPPADPVLRQLHAAIDLIEKELGHPQDVEWAVQGDEVVFLQTRRSRRSNRRGKSRFYGRASFPRSVSLGRFRRSAGRYCRAFSASTWRRSPGASA